MSKCLKNPRPKDWTCHEPRITDADAGSARLFARKLCGIDITDDCRKKDEKKTTGGEVLGIQKIGVTAMIFRHVPEV